MCCASLQGGNGKRSTKPGSKAKAAEQKKLDKLLKALSKEQLQALAAHAE